MKCISPAYSRIRLHKTKISNVHLS